MALNGNLLAWIERCGTDAFVGAFVGEAETPGAHRASPGRAPATRLCSSPEEARQWVTNQAAELDLPIKWVG
jgi:hypothetical protein